MKTSLTLEERHATKGIRIQSILDGKWTVERLDLSTDDVLRVVNSHEALLQAAKAALITINDDETYERYQNLRLVLEKAIAKAEGMP